jgi:hypothetical protein
VWQLGVWCVQGVWQEIVLYVVWGKELAMVCYPPTSSLLLSTHLNMSECSSPLRHRCAWSSSYLLYLHRFEIFEIGRGGLEERVISDTEGDSQL